VDYVVDQVVSKLIEVVKKKNKAGVSVKPFQVSDAFMCSTILPHHACFNVDHFYCIFHRLKTIYGFLLIVLLKIQPLILKLRKT
jgi:hypothetical protein